MKQTDLQITGGNNKGDRRELDFYPTPANVTRALMLFLQSENVLMDPCKIWEPAAGPQEAMSNEIRKFGHTVYSTDIITGTDFLNCYTLKVDAIITNPPFNLSEQFIRRSLQLSPITCILSKAQFWHAAKRKQLFDYAPPAYICPLTWRPDFLEHERNPGDKKGSPTMDVLWTVWLNWSWACKYQPLLKPH